MSITLPSTSTEADRQQILSHYGILDTPREQAFDDLAALAAYICKAPIAAITFFDGERQWFKSSTGVEIDEAPMELSFCTYVALDPETPFVVEDATRDARFADAPHVTGGPELRSYAGAAVVAPDGVPLGTICVFDTTVREFDADQLTALRSLSRQIVAQLELRKRVEELEHTTTELRVSNDDLHQFGYIVSHDLKAPIRQQSAFAELMLEDFPDIPKEMRDMLGQCRLAGHRAARILDDIDKYLREGTLHPDETEAVPLSQAIASVSSLVIVPPHVTITYEAADCGGVLVPAAPVRHILANLISNAIKYNDKEAPSIRVSVEKILGGLHLYVEDNGPGILDRDRSRIFQIFARGSNASDAEGRGLGLAICLKLLRGLGGQLSVNNLPSGGAQFCASIPV